MGEMLPLLGNIGVSVHAVDFKRLRERGGLKTLGAPPATAIVVLPPQHSALAWIADDPEVVAIMHPPVTGAALLATLRTAAKVESSRAMTRTAREGEELLEIGRALSSERD